MLVDTNVLLRSVQPSHPLHESAREALKALMASDQPLFITIQNVAEFWNAATRPVANNGLGYSVEEARQEVARLEGFFDVLSESPVSYREWKALLTAQRVSGVQVHDARLVSIMRAHGIETILTFDKNDFVRFPGVRVIHPDEVERLAHPEPA